METLPKLIDKNNIDEFLSNVDNIMTDCDGVIWRTETVIENANVALNTLRKMGKRVFYVTNNSTKTRNTLVSKCVKHGFIANDDEAISSSVIIAEYLKGIKFTKKVHILGSEGIAAELDIAGIAHSEVGPDPIPDNLFDLEKLFKKDPDVGAVVVGFDPHFNMAKLMKAASYLKDPNCIFLATNRDEVFPVQNPDLVFPGTGSILTAVETAAGRRAESVGKPDPKMFNVLKNKFDLDPKRTIMIGDRCNTDILLGKNCGLQTMAVLTGIHSWDDMESWAKSSDPELRRLLADYYLPSLGDLVHLLPSA